MELLNKLFLNESSNNTHRKLILQSFKNGSTQKLCQLFESLNIQTETHKKTILQEIFRLIQEGLIYIPQGLPKLIEEGIYADGLYQVELYLLIPYEKVVKLLDEIKI